MSVPYYIRIFRQREDPIERRRIYNAVGNKLKSRIRKRFNLCITCFERQAQSGILYCRECDPRDSRKSRMKHSYSYSLKCAQLQPHRRVCVGCEKLFESQRGMNLCRSCVQQAREEVARLTLGRGPNQICTKPTVVTLYKKYGHSYKPSVIPRIPLSTVSVFEAL